MNEIRVKKLREGATLPTYGTPYAAGADLYACLTEEVVIAPGETVLVPACFGHYTITPLDEGETTVIKTTL